MLQKIISYFVVESQIITEKEKSVLEKNRKQLIKDFKAEEVFIKAKDGIVLNGVLCKKPESFLESLFCRKIRKVIVHFGGNAGYYENFCEGSYIRKAHMLGYDVLLSNYRGVCKSGGSSTPEGLENDGISVLNYALNNCGYDQKNIYVHGHSLGGAVATKAVSKTKYNVHLINDRSFSSIRAFINSLEIFWIFKKIISFLVTITKWNIDVVDDWRKIKTKKIILADVSDEVIPLQSSLFKAVKEDTPATQLIVTNGYGHCGDLFLNNMEAILTRVQS